MYHLHKFENLCRSDGALVIFDKILNAMTHPRHSVLFPSFTSFVMDLLARFASGCKPTTRYV